MATGKGHRIGEMLLDEDIISQEQLKECLQEQKVTGEKVGEILVRKGYVTLEVLNAFLGTQMGVPYISLSEMQNIQPALLKLIPEQLMRTQNVIPVSKKGNTLLLAMADPTNVFVTDDIKMTTRCDLELRFSSEKEIKSALDKYFGYREEDTGELVKASAMDDTFGSAPQGMAAGKPAPAASMHTPPGASGLNAMASAASAAAAHADNTPEPVSAIPTATAMGAGDTPVINFLTSVLVEANKVGATDIHFEPYEKNFRIRWRIDGILQEVQSPPRSLANALSTRLKVMAEMDTQTKGQAQQGRLKLKIPGKDVSMSLLIAPTMWGEKVVLHIMNTENAILDLDKIGMEPGQYDLYRRIIQQPHGLILITGPRQSGRTTTAYATLNALNQPTRNVSAIDENIDYSLPGINQVVVNERRGLSYRAGVHAMLAQDADVLLVGEITDLEIARMLLDAVPSGHLIISTLNANDPVSAIQYMVNMGIEPYLAGVALTCIVNVRLVRVVCPQCRETYEAPPEIAKYLGAQAGRKAMLTRGRGCDQCSRTGYRGRQPVYEIVHIKEAIRDMIINKAPAAVMKKAIADTPGFISLKVEMAKKVLAGVTSYDELLRVAS
ncbi:Flp pilus assembly complex ATPase component TadA [candidate division FCPU426 bacterium]|nr:Flp pilus assembly complex ATPase component TadA [candidate division FCPU426 bacterium]